MKAGSLRYIITIEEPVTTRDEYGSLKVEWKEVTSTRADITNNRGYRNTNNSEVHFDYTTIFNIRFYHNVSDFMRIKYNNRYYRIISVQNNFYTQSVTITTELINE